MRTRTLRLPALLGLLLVAAGFSDCEAPVRFVFIDGPETATFTEAQTVTITATAAKQEGLTVREVRFYRDDREVGTDTTPPYTYDWLITASDNGTHRFHAEADYTWPGGGDTLRSDEVTYEVDIELAFPSGQVAKLVGSMQIASGQIALDETGSIAVVASRDNGLSIIDLANPARPRLAATLNLDRQELSAATDKAFAYVVEGRPDAGTSLAIVDLRDPTRPSLAARLELPGKPRGRAVEVEGSYVYVAATDAGLQVIDVSQPRAPRIIGSGSTSAATTYARVADGLVLLGGELSGLSIVDVRDPRRPVEMLGGGAFLFSGIEPLGGAPAKALLANRAKLWVWDISNPSRPKTIGSVEAGGWELALLQDYAFLAELDSVRIVDVSDHSNLEAVQELAVPNIEQMVAGGSLVLAVDRSFHMSVISLSP